MSKSHFNRLSVPIALLFAILAGCGNLSQVSEPITNGQGIALLKISATASGPFQKLAKTATLTISAGDMLTMTKSLAITDSSVQGTITGIPAGKNRLFSVSVYDSLDTLQYEGSATANVIADSTVKVSINVVRVMGNAIVTGNIIDTNAVTVTDIDGNVYHTVSIGTQVWMVENLKTTKYKDGTAIPLVTANSAWAALTTPGYCWYSVTYGALYNWYAVNTGKLAPTGWHVPTDSEWTVLIKYLGDSSMAGGPLKETGTTYWASPNSGATNASGFSALPGGWRNYDGTFGGVGNYGDWWSSTASVAASSWYRDVNYSGADVGRSSDGNDYGFSVRCVRDH